MRCILALLAHALAHLLSFSLQQQILTVGFTLVMRKLRVEDDVFSITREFRAVWAAHLGLLAYTIALAAGIRPSLVDRSSNEYATRYSAPFALHWLIVGVLLPSFVLSVALPVLPTLSCCRRRLGKIRTADSLRRLLA